MQYVRHPVSMPICYPYRYIILYVYSFSQTLCKCSTILGWVHIVEVCMADLFGPFRRAQWPQRRQHHQRVMVLRWQTTRLLWPPKRHHLVIDVCKILLKLTTDECMQRSRYIVHYSVHNIITMPRFLCTMQKQTKLLCMKCNYWYRDRTRVARK